MAGPFARIGAGLDWLFGRVAGSVRGTVNNRELRRVVGVGLASALSLATPLLIKAAAEQSPGEINSALVQGFISGVLGAVVSYLHRKYDDGGPLDFGSPTSGTAASSEVTNP